MKQNTQVQFRIAQRGDCPLILDFVRNLAKYEKLDDEVVATVQGLEEWLFEKLSAEVFFAVVDGKEVGFALYFTNFSTFLGKAGLYLEDIFVLPEYRGQGIGAAMLEYLATVAVDCDFGRLELSCLNWNTDSIEFYESLGAQGMSDWTTYRFSGDSLDALANK
ncbi:MAG: GNAT family N-acetyltransferase [Oscillospiraceae bacterium]|nr:GNAT family N-acetyltransferase [Oscillospiraceae bacterium]